MVANGQLADRIRLLIPVFLFMTELPRGDVAQLGEHCLCKAGVAGSIPVVSINSDKLSADFCMG